MSTNYGKLNFSTSFDPTSAFPIDARSYFENYDTALAAAQSAKPAGSSESKYYYGQLIIVATNLNTVDTQIDLYYIKQVRNGDIYSGILEPVASTNNNGGTATPLIEAHLASTANPHSTSVTNLSDVDITDKTDGYVLTWSDEKQKFILEAAPAGTGTGGATLPTGGTAGQVLTKIDDADGNAHWADLPAGGTGGVDMTQIQPLLDAKVDKIEGKGLSENDLTTVKQTRYEEAYDAKHVHDNTMILSALTDVDGVLKYNGQDIASSSALTAAQLESLANSDAHIGSTANPHGTTIINLADVAIVDKTNGHVLTWSEEQQKFILSSVGVEVENGYWKVNGALTNYPVTDTTGRVRLEAASPQMYLKDVIDGSLVVDNNLLKVVGINGLKTPIAQLNLIQGLDKNIMEYLTLMSGSMTFKGVLNSDDELNAITSPADGDTYIVKNSASNDNSTVTMVYSNGAFTLVGETNIKLRDFTAEPIDLTTEVEGILPMANVENAHKHDNKNVLDLLTDAGGELLYNGKTLNGAQGEAGKDATTNYNELERKPQINAVTLVGNKTFKQLGAYLELVSKEEFESEVNKGNVKSADVAEDVNAFINQDIRNQPYMYYGTNSKNEVGKHILPINANDNSAIQQRIFENVVAGDSLSFDSITNINNKALINVYTEIKGQENITGTIKEFNENTQQSFICSPGILFTETACGLTGSKIIKPTYNTQDEVYEYDLSEFITITNCTEIV